MSVVGEIGPDDYLEFDNSAAKFTPEQMVLIRVMATTLGWQAAAKVGAEVASSVAASVSAHVGVSTVEQMIDKGVIARAIADGVAAGQNYTSEIIRDSTGQITHVRRQVA